MKALNSYLEPIVFGIILTLIFSMYVLGLLAYQSIWIQLENHSIMIEHAPVNPSKPVEYGFLTGSFELENIIDTAVPVTCQGHRLMRIVEQYLLLPGQDTLQLLPVSAAAVYNPRLFWLQSKSIYEPYLNLNGIKIETDKIPLELFKSGPEYLSVQYPLGKNITQLENNTFFVGYDHQQPQENNLLIHYECEYIPPVTAWGTVTSELTLDSSSVGNGISELPLSAQKKILLEKISYGKQSMISLCAVLAVLTILIVVKTGYVFNRFSSLRNFMKKIKKFELWLSLPILFVPVDANSALIISCIILLHFGLTHLDKNNTYRKNEFY
jgi:hypothetical protein